MINIPLHTKNLGGARENEYTDSIMDLEQLNKTQIILLTLLVSFVTSIATGIVTVSLVNQAPQGVTQTVNRIVERTVERVVPDTSNQGASVITKTEKTVVVKDDDLSTQSIEAAQKSVIKVVPKGVAEAAPLARGIIIDTKGTAVVDREALQGGAAFEAILYSGARVPLEVEPAATSSPLSVVKLTLATSSGVSAARFADPAKLRLGQSVIRLGGKARDSVAVGVVAALPDGVSGRAALLESSATASFPGSILMTIFGEVVGITTAASLVYGPEFYTKGSEVDTVLSARPAP